MRAWKLSVGIWLLLGAVAFGETFTGQEIVKLLRDYDAVAKRIATRPAQNPLHALDMARVDDWEERDNIVRRLQEIADQPEGKKTINRLRESGQLGVGPEPDNKITESTNAPYRVFEKPRKEKPAQPPVMPATEPVAAVDCSPWWSKLVRRFR